ncbi:MAG: DNA segregation ATPase FtsK/SpoIIIE, S-DNA-T family [Microgenomates group bacterium LiPW_16]|nr:MAG: DNA segregation ATPase FtsK/SpoIIIE, S-DNA-T family [Microgenomates group bacterium LiPW_16]
MRRRYYHPRSLFKLRLKKQTIYSLSSIILFGCAGITIISFTQQGTFLAKIYNFLVETFGWGALFLPIVLSLFGLLFLRLKIAKPNVAAGFALLWISLLSLTQSGTVGREIWLNIEVLITGAGAFLIFFGLSVIGLTILANTSLDQVLLWLVKVFTWIFQFGKTYVFGGLLKKKKPVFVQEKLPIKVRGEEKLAKPPLTPPPIAPELGTAVVANLPAQGIWECPPLTLLSEGPGQKADRGDLKTNAAIIEKTLESFGIAARVVEINLGPAVTQYALEIALGTKLSKITSLSNDLALALAAPTGQIRIEAPVPGRSLVGIEIPNRSLEFVTLKQMLSSEVMQNAKSKLTVALGLDVAGNPVVSNIARMPHVLIAGTTGSGKSVLINSWIASLLFRTTPNEVKLILVDPKRVELIGYNGIPHLLTPVIVDVDKILSALKWALSEMDRRYKLFASTGVRNIDGYNELSGFQALPYIVIFIDELADLMAYAPVEVEDAVCRIAQMARATGIHLIVSTQRPSVDVLTGLIKANIPCRIAFNVSSMVDSRVIIDMPGAEKLLGRGDMLYIPPDQAKPTRIQGTYVSEQEVFKLVDCLKSKGVPVEYTEEVTSMPLTWRRPGAPTEERDELLEEAVRVVCQYDRASASLLQRRLSIGYARAARILDQLEEEGLVGPGEGAKPRDVLVRNAEEFLSSRAAKVSE